MPDPIKKEQVGTTNINTNEPPAPGNIDAGIIKAESVENTNNELNKTVLSPNEQKIEKPIDNSEQVAEQAEAVEAQKIADAQNKTAEEAMDKKEKELEDGLKQVNQPPQSEPEVKQEIPSVEPQINTTPVQPQVEILPVQPVKKEEQPKEETAETITTNNQVKSTTEITPPPLSSDQPNNENLGLKSIPSETKVTMQSHDQTNGQVDQTVKESIEEQKPWWKFWETKPKETPSQNTIAAIDSNRHEDIEDVSAKHPEK